ncbi:MAG: RNA 2',3'-cyclic phosphodiesterase [Acidobacteriota bacterium]|nr:RNA 2',3'-cyclic phosphodiesterase [Acidobacteriota bacterium]
MRLFLAIDLPHQVLFRLDRLLSALRPEALITWSPLDNLHITTKFIGEWPENRIHELHVALLELPPRDSFEVELSGLGWFPNKRSPRVLWAAVDGGESLKSLAHDVEDRLAELGIKPEEREFSPHLTLARIKHPAPLGRLRQKVEEMQKIEIGKFPVSHFTLFRSDPGSNSSIYRKLHEYKFEAALAASGSEQ